MATLNFPYPTRLRLAVQFCEMKKKKNEIRTSCLLESSVELNTKRKPKAQFLFQFSSVTQLCPTLFNPMDCSIPGFPIPHQLLERPQTHLHLLISFSGSVKIKLTSVSSVQFSRSVVSDSLRPHESQHTRLPCPSPFPGVHSNSCPSSR